MLFKSITDADFADIADIQRQTKYNGSEYSLLYLKGWDFFNFKSMQIAKEDGASFIRFMPKDKYAEEERRGWVYLPPLCALDKVKESYDKIKDICDVDGVEMAVMSTPEEYVELLGGDYQCIEDVDYAEYLYDPQSLMTYAGKKLHSKRNHVNAFTRNYCTDGDVVFRAYSPSDRDGVLAFVNGWEDTKEFDKKKYDDMANNEVKVIILALSLVESREEYFADLLEYKGNIIGFSLGEITASGVGITHIEKADVEYEGVYSYLCQVFAQKHYGNARIVNRQEDMGLEGLRKSKQSYRPIGFCKKFVVKKSLQ